MWEGRERERERGGKEGGREGNIKRDGRGVSIQEEVTRLSCRACSVHIKHNQGQPELLPGQVWRTVHTGHDEDTLQLNGQHPVLVVQ